MADNVSLPASSGTVAADEVADGTLGTVKVQYVKLMDGTLDGTVKAAVGSAGLKVDASQGTASATPWNQNTAQVGGNAVAATLTGTQDVLAITAKRASTTKLAPNYYAIRLAAKATTTPTASTAYLSTLVITTSAAGSAMSITVQDKSGTPIILYTIASAVAGTVVVLSGLGEPLLMTGGIDILIGGTTAGVVNVFMTFWQ